MSVKEFLLSNISFMRILLAVLVIVIVRVGWLYVKLWLKLQDYKKKGAKVYFDFPFGILSRGLADTKTGDALAWHKKVVEENPNIRVHVTHFGPRATLQLIDPKLSKIFLSEPMRYTKSTALAPILPLLEHGLLFAPNSRWKIHRKALSSIFRFDFIISQVPNIVETAQKTFAREIEAQKGKNINIMELYQLITGELVFRIFFGEDLVGVTIDGILPTTYLASLLELAATNIRSPESMFFGLRGVKLRLFKRNREYLDRTKRFMKFCKEIINKKKIQLESKTTPSANPDFVTLLLQTKGTEDEYTDDEILHEFITFFFAGMDTTGHMLTMATYFFAKSSEDVQRAVMKEADEIAKAGTNVTNEMLSKAEVIHAFMKETLRIATPATMLFGRKVLVDHSIEEFSLKKGDVVNTLIISRNFNPKYFKDPYEFNMNRWIPASPDYAEAAHKDPFVFTPFSAGPRNCIGQHLAMLEGKIIWSIFLSNYKYSLPPGYEMHYKLGMLYEPRETLCLDIEKKKL